MKINQYLLFIFLILISCSQKNTDEKNDTFSLDKVDIAMIYQEKVTDIPCLLFNVTDTVKRNQKIGVIFKLDLKYDNPRKGGNCCAFEPGVDGTKEKIKSVKIFFTSNNKKIDITDKLTNIEEAQMFNRFEDYIQGKLYENDFSCECYDQKSGKLIQNLKREHLGGNIIKREVNKNKNHVIKNIDDFINLYNSLAGEVYKGKYDNRGLYSGSRISHKYYSFWLPDNFNIPSEAFDNLEIEIELLNGRKLNYLRSLK
ncbi:hypothetical protein [uncultured Flavobacterium sp.]|uniref:hypothetical protein n=1 Tax=uncultured Flavobacterium sp. TaxID=165435 RepID=UPI003081C5AA